MLFMGWHRPYLALFEVSQVPEATAVDMHSHYIGAIVQACTTLCLGSHPRCEGKVSGCSRLFPYAVLGLGTRAGWWFYSGLLPAGTDKRDSAFWNDQRHLEPFVCFLLSPSRGLGLRRQGNGSTILYLLMLIGILVCKPQHHAAMAELRSEGF
jgi:hypothetical protein